MKTNRITQTQPNVGQRNFYNKLKETAPENSESSTTLRASDRIQDGFESSDKHAAELKAIKRQQALFGAAFGAIPLSGPALTGMSIGGLTRGKTIGRGLLFGAAGLWLGVLTATTGVGGFLAGMAVSSVLGGYVEAKNAEAEHSHFSEKRDNLVESADFVESMEFPSINMGFETKIKLKTGNTFSMDAFGAYLNGEVVTHCTREWTEDGIHLGSGTDEHTIKTDGSSHVSWTSKAKSYQVDRDVNGEWGPVMTKDRGENSAWEVSNLKLRHDKKRLVVGTGESLGDIMEVDLMVDPKEVVGH